ncbi:uncharacterized protein BXIN_2419 [Babesia sp. Xinjiang]|uniref:uncharacterized protein n=1 Tax=Babesia sp. Xinjiang TaxID=462227 RepID=UPI000A23997C|nr:uncharacterized protein BXIN_2419 [Babesia sp. Xinjiang]ORM40733.1 hypothetical protein BXIN_2419 [Babesia sp. Xinjiang]
MREVKSYRSVTCVERRKETSHSEARASTRLKNINLTKFHAAYERYLATVPRELRLTELRDSWHPVTPDHRSSLSISQWNCEIGAWRRQVYLWNDITDSQRVLLCDAVRKADSKLFLAICEPTLPQTSPEEGYDLLLGAGRCDLPLTPLLYKPSWFKGQITHSGFRTIEESEFLIRALRGHSFSVSAEFRMFHEDYTRSFTERGRPYGCE